MTVSLRLDPHSVRERAGLGDPAAIGALLKEARSLCGSPRDDTFQGLSIFTLVFSILNPDRRPTIQAVGDGTSVEQRWKTRRGEFVQAFVEKYRFDPDAGTIVPEHLQHWPGLFDRVGDKIVIAPEEDVNMAKGYLS